MECRWLGLHLGVLYYNEMFYNEKSQPLRFLPYNLDFGLFED